MSNKQTAEKIKNHLEFLGYEATIDDKSNEGGFLVIQAPSKQKPNLLFWFNENGIISVKSGWTGLKKIETVEQWQLLNKCNAESMFLTRIYIDSDGILQFQSHYIGEYDKIGFGNFIDIVITDITRILANAEFKTLLVE